ncbi:MAG: hypothetical protein Q4G46_07155 [Propionibacteriaceae bacterium]|nr:hypothetical protein [Propionibacteriaceae bacterium]
MAEVRKVTPGRGGLIAAAVEKAMGESVRPITPGGSPNPGSTANPADKPGVADSPITASSFLVNDAFLVFEQPQADADDEG